MAAPFYALARWSPCSSDPDRVAVIPASIYVTYTLCGDKDCIAKNTLKVNKTAGFSSFNKSHKRSCRCLLRRIKDKLLIGLCYSF